MSWCFQTSTEKGQCLKAELGEGSYFILELLLAPERLLGFLDVLENSLDCFPEGCDNALVEAGR